MKMYSNILLLSKFYLIILFFAYTTAYSQNFSEQDLEIFNSKIKLANEKNLKDLPLNEIFVEIAKSFISTPYIAHTLEITEKEELVINLRGLDCTTFLETSLALSLCIKNDKTSFEDFQNFLTHIRYRGGLIKEYPSRLHYFSDWIFDNKKKQLINDVTKELDGIKIKFNVNYMSKNPHLYKHLTNNDNFVSEIKKYEKDISNRVYYYIPANNIASIEDKIQNGDIIALTSNQKGLDIRHVGIAIKKDNNKTYFLHAPQIGSFVQVTNEILSDYVKKNKKHSGIIVLRLNQ